jgi:hypothetical protein
MEVCERLVRTLVQLGKLRQQGLSRLLISGRESRRAAELQNRSQRDGTYALARFCAEFGGQIETLRLIAVEEIETTPEHPLNVF